MKPQYISLFVATLVLALLTSCSKPGSEIIGTWSSHSQFQYGVERAEFFKDGACAFENQGQRIAGNWIGLDDKRIRVTISMGGISALTAFASVTGDDLVLDTGSNQRTSYVREPSTRAEVVKVSVKRAVSDREIKIEAEKRAVEERYAAEQRQRERQQQAEQLRSQQLNEAYARNQIAWDFATSRDSNKRDGKRAVEIALQAVDVEPNRAQYLDTLGAAYARNGNFQMAISTQKRALEIENGNSGFARRLVLYEQHQPYEE